MIKYLGSKRMLVPQLGRIAASVGAGTAVDLFTGTTRVAQELKRRGLEVTAVDVASYAEAFGRCYISTDADRVDTAELAGVLDDLDRTPGRAGYVTETFCRKSRYFMPHNGERIDAIRDRIEHEYSGSPLHPLLLTSLIEAADRVDSTTGLQMAYLKSWAPRARQPMRLQPPALLAGGGTTIRGDATRVVDTLPPTDLAYLDPPYNQHRYFTNYHVWETLVRWDDPEHYGVACKRVDARDEGTRSVFNRRREMPAALFDLIARLRAQTVVVSYNDEAWVSPDEITEVLRGHHEECVVVGFDSPRYVGARIGVYNPDGVKVGTPARLRNRELLFIAGERALVAAAAAAAQPEGAARSDGAGSTDRVPRG
ncbi:MAG: DNA adenine methylase [Marmoricola sp.]